MARRRFEICIPVLVEEQKASGTTRVVGNNEDIHQRSAYGHSVLFSYHSKLDITESVCEICFETDLSAICEVNDPDPFAAEAF